MTDEASGLIYGWDEKPPVRRSVLVALQHVLAVFVGIVTPPLIISSALKLSPGDETFLVSMSLLISGIGTLLQSRTIGPLGSGLLSIQGTSFVFVTPVIAMVQAAMKGGATQQTALGYVFGTCLVAALVPIAISPFIQLASRIITPLVTGVVVTLIGLTLVQVGMTSLGGGFAARQNGSFGSLRNLICAGVVILLIVVFSSAKRDWLRMMSIVLGLGGGYLVAAMGGQVSLDGLNDLPWLTVPMPLHYGLGVRLTALIPFCFLCLITAVESIGDLTATSLLSNLPITGPMYFKRLRGGVLADGVTTLLAAVFNSFPSTTFAQNNGVIQLTGVGSRHIGTYVGLILVVLGLSPVVAGIMQSVPQAVLGGATIIMFATVAVSGIRILSRVNMDRRASTIAAVSLGLGLGEAYVPDVLQGMPVFIRDTFSSGIATGGICALVLNAVLPGKRA